MENNIGIWIDGTKAVIVSLSNGSENITTIESDLENRIYHENVGDKGSFMGSQHINNEKRFEARRRHQLNKYIAEVVGYLQDAGSIYIFGPAETKTLLGKSLMENKQLAAKLKKTESCDHLTQNQILAKVKAFYAK